MRTRGRTSARSTQAPWFTTAATVDVDIDPDDLYDAGWHREEDCDTIRSEGKAGKAVAVPPPVTFAEAVSSLHRQAHPGAGSITQCHEEPCRSLTLAQLRGLTTAVLALAGAS